MRFPVVAVCLVACALFLGCSTAPRPLLPGAEAVRIGHDNPPEGMEEIGPIEGVDGHGCGGFGKKGGYENAVIALKNQALSMGVSYVQIMLITEPHLDGGCYRNQFKIRGIAYK